MYVCTSSGDLSKRVILWTSHDYSTEGWLQFKGVDCNASAMLLVVLDSEGLAVLEEHGTYTYIHAYENSIPSAVIHYRCSQSIQCVCRASRNLSWGGDTFQGKLLREGDHMTISLLHLALVALK